MRSADPQTPQTPQTLPAALGNVALLAQLLERLDRSVQAPDAAQYRGVALRMAESLRDAPAGAALDRLLGAFPAAAEVYENLRYAHAGLCRAPLETSLNTELVARAALDRAAAPEPRR